MMWPYMIQLRTKKAIVYMAIAFTFIYAWYYLLNVSQVELVSIRHRSGYVNFKHLLIACLIAAQRGGLEVKKAKSTNLNVQIKGKTKEGLPDILTAGDKMSNLMMVNSLLHTFPGIKIISEEQLSASEDIYPIHLDHDILQSKEFSSVPEDIDILMDELAIWIDPLDATKEYFEGLTQYVTTMVCVAKKGEPIIGIIHQPFSSNTYWASKFGVDRKLLSLRSSSHISPTNRVIVSRSHKGDIEPLIKEVLPNVTVISAAGSGYKTLELLKGNADIYLHKTYIKKWDICAANALLKFASDGTMTTLCGETINFGFESNELVKDGIFATAKSSLVQTRNSICNKLTTSI